MTETGLEDKLCKLLNMKRFNKWSVYIRASSYIEAYEGGESIVDSSYENIPIYDFSGINRIKKEMILEIDGKPYFPLGGTGYSPSLLLASVVIYSILYKAMQEPEHRHILDKFVKEMFPSVKLILKEAEELKVPEAAYNTFRFILDNLVDSDLKSEIESKFNTLVNLYVKKLKFLTELPENHKESAKEYLSDGKTILELIQIAVLTAYMKEEDLKENLTLEYGDKYVKEFIEPACEIINKLAYAIGKKVSKKIQEVAK